MMMASGLAASKLRRASRRIQLIALVKDRDDRGSRSVVEPRCLDERTGGPLVPSAR